MEYFWVADRALGKKVDIKVIASFMDNLERKGFGRVMRKTPHVFFIINKKHLVAHYEELGLEFRDISEAMAKPSPIPKNFEYLLGKKKDFFG